MQCLHYDKTTLYMENVALSELANEFGTPLYAYSYNQILANYKRFDEAFGDYPHTVCYALKANSNPAILRMLAKCGAGADVVSGGELFFALESGIKPEKIVFAGVGKRDIDIEAAIKIGVRGINVESEMEYEVISDIASRLNRVAPVSLRINPDIDIHGHPYIATGRHGDKFGITRDIALSLIEKIKQDNYCDLVGIHAHIGSQIKEMKPYTELANYMASIARKALDTGHRLEYIDMGGGYGLDYERALSVGINARGDDDLAIDPAKIIPIFIEAIKDTGVQLIIEPGRALVANTGVLITEVLYLKKTGNTNIVIVDSGMTELIRPSLYSAYHEIVPLEIRDAETMVADVVGPICESGDFFARERKIQHVGRGDCLAVLTVGAYGYSLASNYNARPKSIELLVRGKRVKVIRERQSLEDLWDE
ncbi:MAG: diaminopimelate decarboxylase [Deferribacteres bacterium]|nr:diaminopimelate decarboxylase [candidate division KSB1 bacterium]MCB9501690.1 diaminopimelate decarboxylase [Deferribacteres bacterium]